MPQFYYIKLGNTIHVHGHVFLMILANLHDKLNHNQTITQNFATKQNDVLLIFKLIKHSNFSSLRNSQGCV